MKNIDGARRWLKRNKIFFDTLAAILLSAMAIIVMIEANRISSYQTELMKKKEYPLFNFDTERISDSTGEYYKEEVIISNVGQPITEFRCEEVMTFLRVQYGKRGAKQESIKIPFIGYYDAVIKTYRYTGELARLTNLYEGNYMKYLQMISEFSEFARERDASGFLFLERYVLVFYTDIWEENHYEVYSLDIPYILTETKQDEVIEDYNKKFDQNLYISLSEISPELLYEMWQKVIQEKEE